MSQTIKGMFLSFSLVREWMNIWLNFDAFEGLQRGITLFRVDMFKKILFVIEYQIVKVLGIKF